MENTAMAQGRSVGAIIEEVQRGETLYLVQYRLVDPIGLAMPAGHVDEGESPEHALLRELFEETGIYVKHLEAAFHNFIDGGDRSCGKGHNGHEWWVYRVKAMNEPQLREPQKHRFVKLMSLKQMRPYIKRGECDPAWFKYILPAIGIL